jgi:NADH:ubiquinone oxidoreductase subunit 2 (subunit N)
MFLGINEDIDVHSFYVLSKNSKFLTWLLVFTLISYIGIPPFLGFVYKCLVIWSFVLMDWILLSLFLFFVLILAAYPYIRLAIALYVDVLKTSSFFEEVYRLQVKGKSRIVFISLLLCVFLLNLVLPFVFLLLIF